MKRMKYGWIAVLLLFILPCIAKEPQPYIWGNYHETLQSYNSKPNQTHMLTHLATLEKIVESSKQYKKQVPPGVYAEIAMWRKMIYANEDVTPYLDKEKALYPQSAPYVDKMADAFMWEGSYEDK